MNQHSYSLLIIIALIIFSIFRRVRRSFGWQQMNRGSLLFRTILLLIIGLLILAMTVSHPISLVSDIAGILIGIILANYGALLTTYEQRDGGWYYRPNVWIGSIVTVIFLVRFIYRFYGIFTGGVQQNMSYAMGDSWSSGLMLIMFAYYINYYVILLKKQKQRGVK